MSIQTDSSAKARLDPPLVGFEDQLAEFCRHDQYRQLAESFAQFVKTHAGTAYLAYEPIPARIGQHLIDKTHAPSAFVTLTLRRPTWANELKNALSDPAQFESYVQSLEAAVVDIAKQTKKLN
jgi:hypothetical protein